MYHYVEYDEHVRIIKKWHNELLAELCRKLREKGIYAQFSLVGSARRCLITQNANEPFDLDYNLIIQKCEFINNCRRIKNIVRVTLDEVLKNDKTLRRWKIKDNCHDSTSALTGEAIPFMFKDGSAVSCSFDLCITAKNTEGNWCRLIDRKNSPNLGGNGNEYVWECLCDTDAVHEKERILDEIDGADRLIAEKYLEMKNTYLRRHDDDHPSYVCYFETVNNVYDYYCSIGVIRRQSF